MELMSFQAMIIRKKPWFLTAIYQSGSLPYIEEILKGQIALEPLTKICHGKKPEHGI